MATIRLAAHAMATRFEAVLSGPRPSALQSAGEEALSEISRLDAALSVYRPESEIAALNRSAALHPVRVSPEVFRLLRHAALLSSATGGAFDITVGPLLRAWGFVRNSGRFPSPETIDNALRVTGFQHLRFDDEHSTVAFDLPGVQIDLGAIGKGYALDRAAAILRDAGIENALLHGGTSTVIALGRPEETETWRVAISPPTPHPANQTSLPQPTIADPSRSTPSPDKPLAFVSLHDESLSVSAVHGKGFTHQGHFYGHVIDPRTGHPATGALLSAMILPSATESDALSTALLVCAGEMMLRFRAGNAPARCLVAVPSETDPTQLTVDTYGISTSNAGS